ncbi:MAG: hypothetical protein KA007_01250 [Candidatus Pacebacteria bacterium]|jgi:hypothetical protein|nr:hypothetical protein [Candidatus Paceibacterota bacterium]
MRTLTAKQKKLLDQFFESRKRKNEDEISIYGSVFKDGDHNIGIDEVFKHDDLLFARLEQINDTEILHQTVDIYLNDKSSDWVYNRNNKKR